MQVDGFILAFTKTAALLYLPLVQTCPVNVSSGCKAPRRRNAASAKCRVGETPAAKRLVGDLSCSHFNHSLQLIMIFTFYCFRCQVSCFLVFISIDLHSIFLANFAKVSLSRIAFRTDELSYGSRLVRLLVRLHGTFLLTEALMAPFRESQLSFTNFRLGDEAKTSC